ncbi:MAG: helix-turn-helix transcriptional regulator [Actinomycetota bacterium]
MTELGSRIREERLRRNMTLVVLSRRSGIAQPNLSRIENGKMDPRWSTVERILAALGISTTDFLADGASAGGLDPWARIRHKAERGEDVRDEAWALAANTSRRAMARS